MVRFLYSSHLILVPFLAETTLHGIDVKLRNLLLPWCDGRHAAATITTARIATSAPRVSNEGTTYSAINSIASASLILRWALRLPGLSAATFLPFSLEFEEREE